MNPDQPLSETFATVRPRARFGVGFAAALLVHAAAVWALVVSISFQLPVEVAPPEPKIVALAPQLQPPPPAVETYGPVDVTVKLPRFRPRQPAAVPERQKREGDPALAIWSYLCNRDISLSEATRVGCPTDFGNVDLSVLDPLNRTGDVGALFGADTATMSLEEAAAKRRWLRPKAGWQGNGARAKGNDLGLPGHDPFAILPQ